LQRIAEQEKLLLEKMKTNRSEVFKQPLPLKPKAISAISTKAKDDSNSESSSSDEDKLPINLEKTPVRKTKGQKKRDRVQFNDLAMDIGSFALVSPDKNEDIPPTSSGAGTTNKTHELTPIRKKKKKSKKSTQFLQQINEEQDDLSVKKKKKGKKRTLENDFDDDEQMPTIENEIEESKLKKSIEKVKAKKVKLQDASDPESDTSIMNDEAVDEIDKLNELHHATVVNVKIQNTASLEDLEKKLNKGKGKKKKFKNISKSATDDKDDWSVNKSRKLEKYERKKLKYKLKALKQQKLLQDACDEKLTRKAKKHKRKEEKKKFKEHTENVLEKLCSVEL
jgi:hypothetical protein